VERSIPRRVVLAPSLRGGGALSRLRDGISTMRRLPASAERDASSDRHARPRHGDRGAKPTGVAVDELRRAPSGRAQRRHAPEATGQLAAGRVEHLRRAQGGMEASPRFMQVDRAVLDA
jgi:hypothetical protein